MLGRPLVYRGNVGGVEVAWLDPSLLRPVFVPGTGDGGGPWAWGGQVAPEARGQLVAAFNGGFKLGDLPGGWYAEGRDQQGSRPRPGVARDLRRRPRRPSASGAATSASRPTSCRSARTSASWSTAVARSRAAGDARGVGRIGCRRCDRAFAASASTPTARSWSRRHA